MWKTEVETKIEVIGAEEDQNQGMDGVNPNSESLPNAGIVERQATLKEIVGHHRRKMTREAELML